MRQTQAIMGMPITIILPDGEAADFAACFDYFRQIDEQFSPYKATSDVSRFNAGELTKQQLSADFQHILRECERTKQETNGHFDAWHNERLDPSGLVKGWAIRQVAELLERRDVRNFCVSAGGDMQLGGRNEQDQPWEIGLRSPFNHREIIKHLRLTDAGVATSGTDARGQHIYNPFFPEKPLEEIVSLTVIATNIYDADRFATAAFAMGHDSIAFIESRAGLEGYMIDSGGIATFTSGFEMYVA